MRFKYYLRGCGLGILFTVILLTVAFHTRGEKEISNEEIIRRAEALGMVIPEEPEDEEHENPEDPGESQADGEGQPEESEK